MPSPRADAYDKALTALFQPSGYDRVAPRTYARSEKNLVWRGLRIAFHNAGKLAAQPGICVFCPSASKIVERGMSIIYGPLGRDRSKLGRPLLIYPLYDLIHRFYGEERNPYSYDIEFIDQVDTAASLVHQDFIKAAEKYFGHIQSLCDLREAIISAHHTAAGIDAMVLGYLIDPKITSQEIDTCAQLNPSPMTEKFTVYFKQEIGLTEKT